MKSLMENPAVVGLIIAIPSAALGLLSYRRSRHNDAVAEQAGIASSKTNSIGQVIAAQDTLIENLLEVNVTLRENVKELNLKVDHIILECRELKQQLAAALSQGISPATEPS